MGIIQIAAASRTGMRFIISLYGMSETGKTLSGLKLAAGLEPDPAKRGLLDTEGGQRGRAYADHVAGGYLYGQLTSPFTPERYVEAISDFEAMGVNVLVIDSVSHAWAAEGGVLDMVENAPEKNDMAKWAKPKRRLSKMTRRILSSDMHIILCSRAKQPMIEEVVEGRKKYIPGPVIPIQEKSLRFDMTIMAQMTGDGHFKVSAPEGKCPGALRPIFAAGEVMDETMGRKLADWIKGDDIKTPAQRELEIRATAAADRGTEPFRDFWKALEPAQRSFLKPNLGNYESMAKAADRKDDEPFGGDDDKPDDQQTGEPFKIESEVRRTEDMGEEILAEDAAADAAFTTAESTAASLIASLDDMSGADLDEFKGRAHDVIRGLPITEDQKGVLNGRFNAAWLNRKKNAGAGKAQGRGR